MLLKVSLHNELEKHSQNHTRENGQNQVLKSYNLRVTQKIEMMDSHQTYKCHPHFLT